MISREDRSVVGLQAEGFYTDGNGLPLSVATQIEIRSLYQNLVSMWNITTCFDLTEPTVRRILGMADWDRYGNR